MTYLDLFFNDLPTREEGNSVDDIYAITKFNDVGYHVQVTIEQYNSMVEENKHLPKESSIVLRKFMKTLTKLDGTEDCPIHVFAGYSVIDLYDKKTYKVDNANKTLTNKDIEYILKKVDKDEL